jgi:hypothetical protein
MKAKLSPWLQQARGKSGNTVFRYVNVQVITDAYDYPGKRKPAGLLEEVWKISRGTVMEDWVEIRLRLGGIRCRRGAAPLKTGRTISIMANHPPFFRKGKYLLLQAPHLHHKGEGKCSLRMKMSANEEQKLLPHSQGTIHE